MTLGDDPITLKATVDGKGNFNNHVVWTSSDNSIVEIKGTDETVLIFKKAGQVTIKASAESNINVFDSVTITVKEAVINSISEVKFVSSTPSLLVGQETLLEYSITVNSGTPSKAIKVETDNNEVISVFNNDDNHILVKAKKAGEANVTITSIADSSKSDTIKVIVKDVEGPMSIESLNITSKANKLEVGSTLTVLYDVVSINGASKDVFVSSSNEEIFTASLVDNKVVVSGLKAGSATLTITSSFDGTKFDLLDITVLEEKIEASVTDVNITNKISELEVGSSYKFTYEVIGEGDYSTNVTFSITSGKEFATIDSEGNLNAVKEGEVVIKVTSNFDSTKFDEVTITIKNKQIQKYVAKVEITSSDFTMEVNANPIQLQANVLIAGNTGNVSNKVTWSSSNKNLASIDENGLLTRVDNTSTVEQKVTITAKSVGTSNTGEFVTDSIVVTLKPKESTPLPPIKGGIVITKHLGFQESAAIEFEKYENADSYNVYYQLAGESTFTKIDGMLIREYPDFIRADILGLKAGNYAIKVTANIANQEIEETASIENVTVVSQIREGFAFADNVVPGAYNKDGTLKDNTVILYVTDENKETISLDVQVGSKTTTCVGVDNILLGFKKQTDNRNLDIRFIGNVYNTSNFASNDLLIDGFSNGQTGITIEGVGNDAVANGWGIRVKGSKCVEVKNIGVLNCATKEGDSIGYQQDNDYVWTHNMDIFYGHAGSDGDQAKGDGALDTKGTDHVTHSFNHFWDSGKANLLGMKKSGEHNMFATYHHNWYDHADSRMPRVRDYTTHVYNNYYDGASKYAVGSALNGPSIFVENNYFRGTSRPMLISLQGNDIDPTTGKGLFSGEDGGIIKAFNNTIDHDGRELKYSPYDKTNNPVEFDAVEVDSRNEQIPSSITTKAKPNTYSNFDTNSNYYISKITPQNPTDARNTTRQYAGRVEGGDLKYTFNNKVEDSNYSIINELKSMVTSYKSKLVKAGLGNDNSTVINGEGGSVDPTPEEDAVISLTLNYSKLTLIPNTEKQLKATIKVSGNATSDLTWSSDNTDIASVTNTGLVKVLKEGTVTIKVTSNYDPSKFATCVITVSNDAPVVNELTYKFSTKDGNLPSEVSSWSATHDAKSNSKSFEDGNYNGETYSGDDGVKVDSKFNISFTISSKMKLVIVGGQRKNQPGTFELKDNGKVISDTDSDNVIEVELEAGSHTITRNKLECAAYYMILTTI